MVCFRREGVNLLNFQRILTYLDIPLKQIINFIINHLSPALHAPKTSPPSPQQSNQSPLQQRQSLPLNRRVSPPKSPLPTRTQIKKPALQEVRRERVLSLLEEVQICPRAARVEEEPASQFKIQDKNMRRIPARWVLSLWKQMQLHTPFAQK